MLDTTSRLVYGEGMTTTATLLWDITAQALAMDSLDDDEGYSSEHIIGPKGSIVIVIDNDGDHWVEVEGFQNDPYAAGFVLRADLDFET